MNKNLADNTENEPFGSMEHIFKYGIIGALMWLAIIGIVLYFIVSWISKMF